MKNFLLVFMLVIMGERWEQHPNGIAYSKCVKVKPHVFNCVDQGYEYDYRRVYVIGELEPWKTEKFTVPVPNVPTKAMTKEEAAKANKELSR